MHEIKWQDLGLSQFRSAGIDQSYFDGTRQKDIDAFYASMRLGLRRVDSFSEKNEYSQIVDIQDFYLPKNILDNVRMVCPEDEMFLLFFCEHMEYVEEPEDYVVSYPVLEHLDNNSYVNRYKCDKQKLQCFLQCRMYTNTPQVERYVNMVKMGVRVSACHPLPVRRQSIEHEGQMKILLDVIETVSNIKFSDKDKILVVGSSARGGNTHGLAYDVIGLLLDVAVTVDLYDCYDIDATYDIGNVHYNHHRKNYDYDGTESKYKLILDDAWEEDFGRSWDPNDDVYRSCNYSIKYIPASGDKKNGVLYRPQAFKTAVQEYRATNVKSNINYQNSYMLGHCNMCTELKYMGQTYKDDVYDFFMSYHSVNCVSGAKRMAYGYVGSIQETDWKYVRDVKECQTPIYCTMWDRIEGYEVIFPNQKTVTQVGFIFSHVNNVRPDLLVTSLVLVQDGVYYMVNQKERKDFVYIDKIAIDQDLMGTMKEVISSFEKLSVKGQVGDKEQKVKKFSRRPHDKKKNVKRMLAGVGNPVNKNVQNLSNRGPATMRALNKGALYEPRKVIKEYRKVVIDKDKDE